MAVGAPRDKPSVRVAAAAQSPPWRLSLTHRRAVELDPRYARAQVNQPLPAEANSATGQDSQGPAEHLTQLVPLPDHQRHHGGLELEDPVDQVHGPRLRQPRRFSQSDLRAQGPLSNLPKSRTRSGRNSHSVSSIFGTETDPMPACGGSASIVSRKEFEGFVSAIMRSTTRLATPRRPQAT